MKTNETRPFVLADHEPIEQVGDGVKRQFLGYGPELMAAKVWFEQGAVGYVHDHFHSQVTYVLSGEFEVTIDGEKKILKGGDSFYVAPNKPHGAECKKAGILIDMFSPIRDDFLNGE